MNPDNVDLVALVANDVEREEVLDCLAASQTDETPPHKAARETVSPAAAAILEATPERYNCLVSVGSVNSRRHDESAGSATGLHESAWRLIPTSPLKRRAVNESDFRM